MNIYIYIKGIFYGNGKVHYNKHLWRNAKRTVKNHIIENKNENVSFKNLVRGMLIF